MSQIREAEPIDLPVFDGEQVVVLRYRAGAIGKRALMGLVMALARWRGSVSRHERGPVRVRCDLDLGAERSAWAEVAQIRHVIDAWADERKAVLELVSLSIQSRADYDAAVLQPDLPPLVGISEIADRLGVSRQRASALAKQGRFGTPVAKLGATPVWSADSIDAVLSGTHGAAPWDRRPGRPKASIA